jgi:hypothetical protein
MQYHNETLQLRRNGDMYEDAAKRAYAAGQRDLATQYHRQAQQYYQQADAYE